MAKTWPVAVVIPVYNRRLKLIKTLETVAAQTKLPARVVIVDDGSTDGTAEAARSWLALNARFEWQVIEQPNAGVSVARNEGFAHIGKLPFVCFLDSDDLWPPEFIAEGLRALEGREDLVAAVADRATWRGGEKRRGQRLDAVSSDPLLWLICNDGGILSCSMIRSRAARAAGSFVPGMLASEDTDFLLRLFLLGGVTHSKAAPVLFVKQAPLEPTEPLNLSLGTPEMRYLWTRHLITSLSKLPKGLLEQHERLIRTAVAGRWAAVAFVSLRNGDKRLAVRGLLQAIWWDYDWDRRLQVICALFRRRKDRKEVLRSFSTPYREAMSSKSTNPSRPLRRKPSETGDRSEAATKSFNA